MNKMEYTFCLVLQAGWQSLVGNLETRNIVWSEEGEGMHGWHFDSQRYGSSSSIIFKGICTLEFWGCGIVNVYQSSRAETGEWRERKVLCALSELVAGLHRGCGWCKPECNLYWMRMYSCLYTLIPCTAVIINASSGNLKILLISFLCSSVGIHAASGGGMGGLCSWCCAWGLLKCTVPWDEWLDSADANAWNLSSMKEGKSMWQHKTWSI